MNERIKELYEQARLHAKSIDADIDPKGWMDLYHQKFAELIVRECIEVGLEQKKWVEDQTVFNESDEVWNRARIQQSQHIVDKIKEHWGVDL